MKRILIGLIPLFIGLVASLLVTALVHPEMVMSVRIGLGVAIFLLGALSSAVALTGIWAYEGGARKADRQAQSSRRSFIRRLDHELKNPLTGLRAALANLNEAASPEDRQQASADARRDVERLQRLLADLRKLSELEERPVECLPVQVPGVIQEAIEAAESLPAYQGRQVSVLIANVPPLPPVVGDRDLLGLALFNLVDNALKFTAAGNAVQVRAREDGRSVVIEVADGGPGVPAEDLPHLFEELYRGANARGVPGSGLGLALASRIVELHGGSLKVSSRQGERQGTVFSLHLPAGRGG